MVHEVFMSLAEGILRVAQIEDGRLVNLQASHFDQQHNGAQTLTGRIYLGRVERVVGRLQAAFVEIGLARAGFLNVREARALAENGDRDTMIEECVQDGDTVLVQITKPPVDDKGAQVTADVSLPGRAVVLTPCRRHIAVSRAIEDESERQRLTDLATDICATQGENGVSLDSMDGQAGWVIRTAAVGISRDDMLADMQNVAGQWEALLAHAERAEPPALLHEDLQPIERVLRDLIHADTRSVVIEGEAVFGHASSYCHTHLPSVEPLLSAAATDEHLFDRHDVAGQLEVALSARVALPSGGWVMIETTQAMTTIDVNSGSDDKGVLPTNLEAATVIGHQVRLRALGGLLAVDFIDMSDEKEKQQVMQALDDAFAGDKNNVRIGPMSEFCVVELTRRRDAVTLSQAMRLVEGEDGFAQMSDL